LLDFKVEEKKEMIKKKIIIIIIKFKAGKQMYPIQQNMDA